MSYADDYEKRKNDAMFGRHRAEPRNQAERDAEYRYGTPYTNPYAPPSEPTDLGPVTSDIPRSLPKDNLPEWKRDAKWTPEKMLEELPKISVPPDHSINHSINSWPFPHTPVYDGKDKKLFLTEKLMLATVITAIVLMAVYIAYMVIKHWKYL